MDDSGNGRIHLRKPISGLRVSYYGPAPVPASDAERAQGEAYEQGRADAETVSSRQIMQARKEMAILQDEVLASIQKRYAELSEDFDEQLPDLVLSIVDKIWEGLNLDRDTVLRAIDAALAQIGSSDEKLVLRLCKRDSDLLQERETFMDRYPDLRVETDAELGSGDVIIQSRFGIIDSRIATKIRRVESEIKKVHQ
ncbi:MAG: hypothetical protein JW942_06040 [Opitutales bacterium]|nr:hypothetical protein [Opitutales bacterium]